MAPVPWPAGVRTTPIKQPYVPGPPKQAAETQFERGHRLRLVATGTPQEHKIRLRLPWDELNLFEAWLDAKTGANPGGVLQFLFPHPKTLVMKTAQFILQDGVPYVPSNGPGANWFVDIQMRIFP